MLYFYFSFVPPNFGCLHVGFVLSVINVTYVRGTSKRTEIRNTWNIETHENSKHAKL